MSGRTCQATTASGEPCRATPLRDAPFCFWHNPDGSEDLAQASRLGGLRRRREKIVAGSYDLAGLGGPREIGRVVEIAVLDTLGLENSVARNRTLAYLAMVALKLHEVGTLEERLSTLEQAVTTRQALPPPLLAEHGAGAVDGLTAPIRFVPADAEEERA